MKNSYTVFGLLIYSAIMVFVISCGGDEDDASFINAYPPDNSTDGGVTNRTPTTDSSEPIVDATAEPIDFEAEKSEIQQVYSAFYSAFNSRKLVDIQNLWKEHPDHAQFRVAWVTGGFVEPVGPTAGWPQIESTIVSLWFAQDTARHNWTGSNRFSQFWIRRAKSDPNTLEASARASASYRTQSSGITYAYLIKNEHEDWQLQQIDSVTGHVVDMGHGDPEISKYFTDESAKVP